MYNLGNIVKSKSRVKYFQFYLIQVANEVNITFITPYQLTYYQLHL